MLMLPVFTPTFRHRDIESTVGVAPDVGQAQSLLIFLALGWMLHYRTSMCLAHELRQTCDCGLVSKKYTAPDIIVCTRAVRLTLLSIGVWEGSSGPVESCLSRHSLSSCLGCRRAPGPPASS